MDRSIENIRSTLQLEKPSGTAYTEEQIEKIGTSLTSAVKKIQANIPISSNEISDT